MGQNVPSTLGQNIPLSLSIPLVLFLCLLLDHTNVHHLCHNGLFFHSALNLFHIPLSRSMPFQSLLSPFLLPFVVPSNHAILSRFSPPPPLFYSNHSIFYLFVSFYHLVLSNSLLPFFNLVRMLEHLICPLGCGILSVKVTPPMLFTLSWSCILNVPLYQCKKKSDSKRKIRLD